MEPWWMAMSFDGNEFTDAATMRGRDWPALRQFCVILENRVGSLHELMRHLERDDLRIVALSIVDTVDVAIARVLLDQVERGRELVQFSGFAFFENDVIGVELSDVPQPIAAVCSALLRAEVNVNYMYPLLMQRSGRKCVAIHVDDVDAAISVLNELGFHVLTENDIAQGDDF